MNDVVAEKLTQKVTNMIDEVTDVNLIVRRIQPPQETINKIHERIDAMQAAVRQITEGMKEQVAAIKANEEAIKANEAAIKELEKRVKLIVEGQQAASKDLGNALGNMQYCADEMGRVVSKVKQEVAQKLDGVGQKQEKLNGRVALFTGSVWVLIVLMVLNIIFKGH